MRKTGITGLALGMILAAALLGGCSRSQMNSQIAEAIGTTGMYENNEPVETPKMREARLRAEESEAEEEELQSLLAQAEKLTKGYFFEEATALLDSMTTIQQADERTAQAREAIEEGEASLTTYEGTIAHLCFPTLIEDTSMAFDGDDYAAAYDSTLLTTDEFKAILESLYERNYILIDIHSIAANVTDTRGVSSFEYLTLRLPAGKTPIVLSQDNLNYAQIRRGDGIATKLVLDEDGAVKALYTDSGGHDLTGDYDLIPILDSFVDEHPDFSYRGAKGIVSVSGSEGVFGYSVESAAAQDDEDTLMNGTASASLTQDQQTVAAISAALRANGWSIACAGYTHSYMDSMSLSSFQSEMSNWINEVEKLTGDCDILFFPYGAEVSYPGDNLDYLVDNGFVYLCGLWGNGDFTELGETYMRQTRRFIDGYSLQNASSYFTDFFDASAVVDSDR